MQAFISRYEAPALPVVIAGIPQQEGWAAPEQWTDWEWLRTRLGERLFKVGEDDDGYKVKIKLKYFLSYLRANRDDSPMCVNVCATLSMSLSLPCLTPTNALSPSVHTLTHTHTHTHTYP